MNVDERIAKLEALLARVRSRAHGPKTTTNGAHEAKADAPISAPNGTSHASPLITDVIAPPPPPPYFPPPPASGTRLQTLPPPEPELPPPSFLPPQPRHTPRPTAPPIGEVDERTLSDAIADMVAVAPPRPPQLSHVRAIEAPPLEVIELDIDPDPSVPPPAPPPLPHPHEEQLESRSRLVSAPPAELPEEPDEDEDDHARPTIAGEALVEASRAQLSAQADDEEPAPSSSRRAISLEEKLHSLAEEGEIAGHHTPPPESGRLLAAPVALEVDPQESTGVRRADDVAAFDGSFDVAQSPATFGQLIELTLKLGE